MINEGSTGSFILQALAEALKLEIVDAAWLTVSTLNATDRQQVYIYKVPIFNFEKKGLEYANL